MCSRCNSFRVSRSALASSTLSYSPAYRNIGLSLTAFSPLLLCTTRFSYTVIYSHCREALITQCSVSPRGFRPLRLGLPRRAGQRSHPAVEAHTRGFASGCARGRELRSRCPCWTERRGAEVRRNHASHAHKRARRVALSDCTGARRLPVRNRGGL